MTSNGPSRLLVEMFKRNNKKYDLCWEDCNHLN